MKTVEQIIKLNAGLGSHGERKNLADALDYLKEHYIRIENAPYMRLVIENIGKGPRGLPAISVAHYGEQNGDAMRDPEMVFEVFPEGVFSPIYFRNDYAGIEQEALYNENGKTFIKPKLVGELKSFASMWDRNIREQGFVQAFERELARRAESAE